MAGFSEIIGQEHIKSHFRNAVKLGKAGHAYILEGDAGTGKKMIAKAAAMVLQCEAGNGEACGMCQSCKQMMSGNQPDVKILTHEKPATIGVEDVRDQLVTDILTKPYSSRYKIYIIPDAEKLTVQAQNAILKTIEEPPAYGIILLLTQNRETFLQTILSRCISMHTRPLTADVMKTYLMRHCSVPDYQAEDAVAFAEGNLGKAMRLANGDDFADLKQNVLNVAKKITSLEEWEAAGLAKQMAERKEQLGEYLDLLELWLRDVLYVKSGEDFAHIHFIDERELLMQQARGFTFHGLQQAFEKIAAERARIKANVNLEMSLELMLTEIHEAYKLEDKL
ncbi:MAG: DNA polymerase III subunit delta [Lachnospiraceae bacterium]|nr:DNA polymerase III subunit delta [Lachnospiraceae bacterium]